MRSAFYPMLNRLKLINRWALMRNTSVETVMEHSYQTTFLAHALALIRKRRFPELRPVIEPDRVIACALYHDVTEIITGDMPTPIKYGSRELRAAYAEAETFAAERLLGMLPDDLAEEYRPYLFPEEDALSVAIWRLVKAADSLSAYLKCLEETSRGNREFAVAEEQTLQKLKAMALPELDYFMEHFAAGFALSLDELQA